VNSVGIGKAPREVLATLKYRRKSSFTSRKIFELYPIYNLKSIVRHSVIVLALLPTGDRLYARRITLTEIHTMRQHLPCYSIIQRRLIHAVKMYRLAHRDLEVRRIQAHATPVTINKYPCQEPSPLKTIQKSNKMIYSVYYGIMSGERRGATVVNYVVHRLAGGLRRPCSGHGPVKKSPRRGSTAGYTPGGLSG
jgi:hypothetical protein